MTPLQKSFSIDMNGYTKEETKYEHNTIHIHNNVLWD
jgi:hypothetical protein